MKKIFSTLFLAITFYLSASASVDEKFSQRNHTGGAWTSAWMCDIENNNSYEAFFARKTISLDKKPEKFKIRISADNRYIFYVNGVQVSRGPARGMLRHWYYESVDIAPYLKNGKNILAAIVWNFEKFAPAAQISNQTALLVDGESTLEDIANTPNGWKTIKAQSFSYGGYRNDAANCEVIDGNKYPWGWQNLDFDDSKWNKPKRIDVAYEYSSATGSTNWELRPREIPSMEEFPQRFEKICRVEGVDANPNFIVSKNHFTIPPNTKCSFIVDNKVLTTSYPQLLTSSGKGSQIKVSYAEALVGKEMTRVYGKKYSIQRKSNRNDIENLSMPEKLILDIFKLDGGASRLFSTLWYRCYRYVQLEIETADEPLIIEDFYGIYTAYPFTENAKFTSDDKSLEDIWNVGWRTARLCANETYVDCPYYEQLQYVGDTRIQALISLYVSGDDRLMKQAIKHFDLSRDFIGLTQSRFPANKLQTIPTFSLHWISMVYDYMSHRDDTEFVKSTLGGIRSVLDWFETQLDPTTGMLKPSMPYWMFADWCNGDNWVLGVPPESETNGSAINTFHYAIVLREASKIMEVSGDKYFAKKYYEKYRQILKAVQKNCYDKSKRIFLDYAGAKTSSQHVNVLAILADAIPKNEQKPLFEKIISDKSLAQCSFYYKFYLMEAMYKAGASEMYLENLKAWRDMIAMGLSTFAETPEPTRSDCHAWSASPSYHLLSILCGIRPDSLGFRTVRISPAMSTLTKIESSIPHPLGFIEINLRRDGEKISGRILLPKGLTGTFVWGQTEIKISDTENNISATK